MPKSRNPKGAGSWRRLKNGSYQWRQRVDGKETTITRKSKQEAQAEVNKLSGVPIIRNKVKVNDILDRFLEHVKKHNAHATFNQYNDLCNKHVRPRIGNRLALKIKNSDIQAIIDDMNVAVVKTEIKNKKGEVLRIVEKPGGYSAWTLKHTKKILHLAFEQAVTDKIIPENPVQKISIPKKQAKRRKVLTIEELAKLFKVMENCRWIHSVKFLLVSALRRGEFLALYDADIDEENNLIAVERSNSSTGLGDTKSRKMHYAPLTQAAKACLRDQQAMLEKEDNPVLLQPKSKRLLFPNKKGEMMDPHSYYKVIARYAEKAGIKASPHCLRHTFVYYNRKKLSLKELQNILGHSRATATTDIYGDMFDGTYDEVMNTLDSTFEIINKKIDEINNEHINKIPSKIIQFSDLRKAK